MKRNRHFFPVCLEMIDESNKAAFTNKVIGGVTYRDMVAIEFMSAMLSNPAYVGAKEFTSARMRGVAIEIADKFVAELGE